MYAVIRTGGKQYKVAEGDTLKVEKLEVDVGATITFDDVLMVIDGDKIRVGTPLLTGSTVSAEVIQQGRHKKINIIKFRRRKHYRRQMGHRQYFTEVKVGKISG